MQKVLRGAISFFMKTSPPQRGMKRRLRGQSLVEVAIAFPVLIMLFTGVVEFGFILNNYLSLLDATRESARYWSNADPFETGTTTTKEEFYQETAIMVRSALDPSYSLKEGVDTFNPSYQGRRIVLDPTVDDVLVSVYGATATSVVLWRGAPYHLFPTRGHPTGNYPSIFSAESIENSRVADAPDAGILVVEVHYNYHHVLSLPWMTMWLPNPLHMRAYTIMPIRAGLP